MTLLLIIFAIATFALLAWVIMKMEELDDYQDNLDKYSVHLDERANRIAANIGVRLLMLYADRICDEDTYAKLFKTLRQMPTRGIFSDSDIARFTNNGKR